MPPVFDWDQMLGRTASASQTIRSHRPPFAGKRVLVTGAGGCIGSAVAKAIALDCPEQLVLIDMSEQGVYEIDRHFAQGPHADRVATVLGDICDRKLMGSLFERHQPQIVVHAAAFKHVPLLERNPFAAIANNTLGTATLAQLAMAHACARFIFVSTDKAADPFSMMGASKRMAEMTLLALADAGSPTRLISVRLGNVLNSPGSVVPLFVQQIISRQAITITHPEAQRYFITIEKTVDALLEAASGSYDDGILIPKMDEPMRVADLARKMFSLVYSEASDAPEFAFIGLRPGDKLKEVLLGRGEGWHERASQQMQLRRVISPAQSRDAMLRALADLRDAVQGRDLEQLIRIVTTLIPAYQPSSVLLEQVPRASGVSQ